jgi:hypothetical protein
LIQHKRGDIKERQTSKKFQKRTGTGTLKVEEEKKQGEFLEPNILRTNKHPKVKTKTDTDVSIPLSTYVSSR